MGPGFRNRGNRRNLKYRKSIVLIDRRLLRVEWWDDAGCKRGEVTPVFKHIGKKHRRPEDVFIANETVAHFKINMPDNPKWTNAEVQRISVVERKQRKGWGKDMYRALFKVFPDLAWGISAPNEKSLGMFNYLESMYPDNIVPYEGP